MRLVDADTLYEKACDLEAQALDYAVKISNDEEKREEWLRWSAILAERTAFKNDVYDAPTAKPEWIPCAERMPKSGEPVLITYRTWRSYLRKYVYFVTIGWHANKYSVREDSFSEWEDDCDYDEDGDVFYIREGWYEFTTQGNCDHASWGICDAEVTAWMPMPEPWEGGEQDE